MKTRNGPRQTNNSPEREYFARAVKLESERAELTADLKALWDEVERTMNDYFAYAGVKEWWATRKHWLTDEFRAVVEAIIAKNPEPKGDSHSSRKSSARSRASFQLSDRDSGSSSRRTSAVANPL